MPAFMLVYYSSLEISKILILDNKSKNRGKIVIEKNIFFNLNNAHKSLEPPIQTLSKRLVTRNVFELKIVTHTVIPLQ